MQNFFIDDKFYSDLGEFIDDLLEEEDLSDLDDDWQIKATECKLEPLVQLTKDSLMEFIYNTEEERFPEESETVDKQLSAALDAVDFSKANELMPKLYYPTSIHFVITKADLLAWL